MPGLIHSLRHNVARQHEDVALFEVGRVFTAVNGQLKEERRVAIALTGQRALPFWSGEERDAELDIYDLKGLAEEFLEQFGLRGVAFGKRAGSTAALPGIRRHHPRRQTAAGRTGPVAARAGQKIRFARRRLSRGIQSRLAANKRNPGQVLQGAAAVSLQPPRRGHARAGSRHTRGRAASRQAGQGREPGIRGTIRRVPGRGIAAGQKSLAYAFTYRAADKTLTDADVNAAHDKVLNSLKTQLQAELR